MFGSEDVVLHDGKFYVAHNDERSESLILNFSVQVTEIVSSSAIDGCDKVLNDDDHHCLRSVDSYG